jgi:hypothetical protein
MIEQVSHHPPISAYVAQGRGDLAYTATGELETKTKFWGKGIELLLLGHERLVDERRGEVYEWNRFNISVNDIILGRFWIDMSGTMRVQNTTTGEAWGGKRGGELGWRDSDDQAWLGLGLPATIKDCTQEGSGAYVEEGSGKVWWNRA